MNKNKELFKNTIIFGFGTIGAKLVQFILVPLYTLYLSAVDYSVSDLISSTVTMLMPFLTLGLSHGIIRFALGNKTNGQSLLRFSLKIIIISTLILFCLIPFFRWLSIFDGKEIYIPILFFVNSLASILSNYCKALEKNIAYSINGIIQAFTTTMFAIFLIARMNLGVDGYLLATIFSGIISILYLSIVCNIFDSLKYAQFNKIVITESLKYCIPLMPNDLAWWIIQMSDRYVIAYICGQEINGIYTMAYKIPGIFNILVSIFISAFTITSIKEFDSVNTNKLDLSYFENIYSKYLATTFILASIVIVATQPIAYFFIKKDFYLSWKYTVFLITVFAIGNLEAYFGSILSGAKKTKLNFLSTAIGAITNTILNLVLIPAYGVYGAIASSIIGYYVVYLIRLIAVKKIGNINLQFKKTNLSLIIILIIALIYINDNFYFKLASILIPFSIVLIYKSEVKQLCTLVSNYIKHMLYSNEKQTKI